MVVIGAIAIERRPAGVPLGRRYTGGLLADCGIAAAEVLLVVSELLTNAVTHGSGGRMGLLLAVSDERIRVEVSDDGTWGRSGTPEPTTGLDLDAECGRGLLLVAAVSEDWGVRLDTTGTVVWAELTLKPG